MSNVFHSGERVVLTSGLRRGAKGKIVGLSRGEDDSLLIEVLLDGDHGTTLHRSGVLMKDGVVR